MTGPSADARAGSSIQVATIDDLAAYDGWLEPLDVQAARVLGGLAGEADPTVRLAVALASRQVRLGHVCLDVPATAATAGPVDEEGQRLGELSWPDGRAWLAALAASPLVATVPDGALPGAPPAEPVPLVLEQPAGRLYLRRWWEHEAALAVALADRAVGPADHAPAALEAELARLFPPVDGPADAGRRDQAAAAALAVRGRLAVITGGPGTGKTTTVVRLLALLVEQAATLGRPAPRIVLAAPTGKAAARMAESIAGALAGLPVAETVRAAIPREAGTIHRALGPRHDGSWRHGPANPLAADVVVVDEASMIDVALMRALVDAVRPDARLVVLGDHRQLASVEAGAVLADLCGRPDDGPPAAGSPAGRAMARPPIADCIAHLTFSFRFGAGGGIGRLAQAIRVGDATTALELLEDPAVTDVNLVPAPALGAGGQLNAPLQELALAGYGPGLERLRTDRPELGAVSEALADLGRFRILCAHRRGRAGVVRVGPAVIAALTRAGLIAPAGEHWRGRPVLVTRNDNALRVYNGDVGLVAPDPVLGGRLRVFFPGPDGTPRAIAPPRLPPHETVFAMTIHKSQGSEFDRVAVVLPDPGSPLLTRELLYTAVTRARSGVTVFATPAAVAAAIDRRAERASGLRQRLWGPP